MESLVQNHCSILVVEDDHLVGRHIVSILREAGMAVVGPIGTVDGALDAIRTTPFEAAFLDIDLYGASGLRIAKALREKAIPFAFISGHEQEVTRDFEYVRFVGKPFTAEEIIAVARQLCAISELGTGLECGP
jgi:DNA-binding response OmpR family regulator